MYPIWCSYIYSTPPTEYFYITCREKGTKDAATVPVYLFAFFIWAKQNLQYYDFYIPIAPGHLFKIEFGSDLSPVNMLRVVVHVMGKYEGKVKMTGDL